MLRRTAFALVAAWVDVAVGPDVRAQSPGDTPRDRFHRVGLMNKASIVMLAEAGIVPQLLAANIAAGIETVIEMEARPGAARSGDYLRFEATLVDVAGPDASRLPTGRSRQDMGSASARMTERDALLDTYEAMLEPRNALVDLPGQHVRTIIPPYTHVGKALYARVNESACRPAVSGVGNARSDNNTGEREFGEQCNPGTDLRQTN